MSKSMLLIIIFLVVFGFLSMFGYLLMTYVVDGFTAAGLYEGQIAETGNKFLGAIRALDYLIVLVLLLLIVSVAITSYRVAASPVFWVVQFVQFIFFGFISYFFNYVFQEMVAPQVFFTTKAFFQNTLIICTNLHWITLAIFVIGSITMYAKKERGQFING